MRRKDHMMSLLLKSLWMKLNEALKIMQARLEQDKTHKDIACHQIKSLVYLAKDLKRLKLLN